METGIGFGEYVLIALLALIVLGPEKLPKLAAQLGRWAGRARSMARNLRQQLEQEVSYDDLKKQKDEVEAALRKANAAPMEFHQDLTNSVKTAVDEVDVQSPSIADSVNEPAPLPDSPQPHDSVATLPSKEAAGSST